MLLPNRDRAHVDRNKVTDYLLSLSHPDGSSKAEFFMSFGFKVEEWNILANALRTVGTSNPVVTTVESGYGVRYTVDGNMETPDSRNPSVRTVWFLESGKSAPRLITAYPIGCE